MKKQSLISWVLALVGLAQSISVDSIDTVPFTLSGADTVNSTLQKPFAAIFNDRAYDPAYDTSLFPRSPERERSRLCTDLSERANPTKEEYKTIIGPWLDTTLQKWRSDNPNYATLGGLAFLNYLTSRYAPDVTAHTRTCDLSGDCFIPTCESYRDDLPLQELILAFWSINSIHNLYSGYTARLKVNHEAFDTIRPDHFIDKYSGLENHKAHQSSVQMRQKLGLSIGLTAALVISSFISVPAGIVGANVLALTNTQTIAALDSFKSNVNMWSSGVAGLYSGLNSIGANSLAIDAGKPDQIKAQVIEQMRQASKDRFEYTQTKVRGDLESLLKGSTSSASSDIAALVKTGDWAEKHLANNLYVAMAKNVWFATYLGMIWKMERTYIVMSDVRGGSCATDDRGPSSLRVCLDEYPSNVFYIYFLPRVREGSLGHTMLRGPPGWQGLEEEPDISIRLKHVVQSSIQSYKRHGNNPLSEAKSEKSVHDEISSIASSGGPFGGFFHIPVCYTPNGEAISSVNEKKSRNYPCMCGPAGWRHYDESTDETPGFLEATGLYQSGDWQHGCHWGRLHTNNCHYKHRAHWPSFPPGKVEVHKPFKKCESRGHRHKGCENRQGNGWEEQGEC